MTDTANRPAQLKLIVVSGLSGAGKSIAMHALEDLGYYCVDNLPVALLPAFVRELRRDRSGVYSRAAVGIDSRNSTLALRGLPEALRALKDEDVESDLLYLAAADEILIKRFSETRRKHPLTVQSMALPEAIRREREIMEPFRVNANICIDTTNTNLHQLRDLIRARVDRRPAKTLSLLFQSFGFKHGVPNDAELVFDVRCLPNPHWEPKLRQLTGRDQVVEDFLLSHEVVREYFSDLKVFLERWIPRFEADNRQYLTVAIGCTGGQHRSVFMAEQLARDFSGRREGVLVRHREID